MQIASDKLIGGNW